MSNYSIRLEEMLSKGIEDFVIKRVLNREFGIILTSKDLEQAKQKFTQKNSGGNSTHENVEEFNIENNKLYLFLKDSSSEKLLIEFQEHFKNDYLDIKTGNEDLDLIIKSIVKDNIITTTEELFLKDKIIELGLPENTIKKVYSSLHVNNPYLDDIIHIILKDGYITSQELIFLREKSIENNYNLQFVSDRFWLIIFSLYPSLFISNDDYKKIVILFSILQFNSLRLNKFDNILFDNLYIFGDKNFKLMLKEVLTELTLYVQNECKNIEVLKYLNFAWSNFETIKENRTFNSSKKSKSVDVISFESLTAILNEEKRRIGTPDAALFAENVKYRLKNTLWD